MALAGAGGVHGQPAPTLPPGATGTLRVTGQGVVTATPDVAILHVGAAVLRDTPDEAFTRAEMLVVALTDGLKAGGVPDKDIRTSELSLFEEPQPPICPPPPPPAPAPAVPTTPVAPPQCQPQPPKWRARHFLTVKLRDFSKIGTIVGDAVAALDGEGQLGGIVFTVEDTTPLADQARAAAADDARAKAQTLATHLGVRLGDVISVQEFSSPPPTPLRPTPLATAVPARTPMPAPLAPIVAPINPGELTITVSVEVVYAIEESPGT
jgi:uncharacterized protein YggE